MGCFGRWFKHSLFLPGQLNPLRGNEELGPCSSCKKLPFLIMDTVTGLINFG